MKIAAFGTMWNEEIMSFCCEGFGQWARDTDSVVDVYACHGRTNMENPFNVGEYAIFDYPDLSKYDGVILIAFTINSEEVRSRLVERVRQSGVPCVVMEYKTDGFSCIRIDQKKCINQMVHHLAEVHHVKKVCYVSGLDSNVESESRLAGFLCGMEECRLEIRKDWIFRKSFHFEDGYDVVLQLLKTPSDFPEAIVCANDDMASGVCEALLDAGMEVGTDCLVTGFDGYVLGLNYAPSLTTVSRPRSVIAYHACQLLTETDGIFDYEEEATLLFRKTCGCCESSFQNEMEFRRMTFNMLNNRNIISTIISNVEEQMISGENISEVFLNMKQLFSRIRGGYCKIMLQPDIEELSQPVYNTYQTCTKEYLLLSRTENIQGKPDGHAYIYAPIHFLNNLYGIVEFSDIPQLLTNKELYNFTKSIGFSLENKIQKRKFSIVNEKLEILYETDYLTGAYNRHGLARHAEEMLRIARMSRAELQIFFIDVDGLKKINDQYGHEAGDAVIRIVGNSACQISGKHTKVFRYGGDEFLVLHEGDEPPEIFISLVEKEIQNKKNLMNLPYDVGASIGYVIAYPEEEKSLDDYIKAADHIMYQIKQKRHSLRS